MHSSHLLLTSKPLF